MGKNTNQIATRSDVNSIRYGSFSASDKKCVMNKTLWGLEFPYSYTALGSSDTKCPKYDDLYNRDDKFFINYKVYNSKNSAASLDYVKVKAGNIYDGGGWVEIGRTSLGSISGFSNKAGSITCKIPTDKIDWAKNIAFRVKCGDTRLTQTWRTAIGNQYENINYIDWKLYSNSAKSASIIIGNLTYNEDAVLDNYLTETNGITNPGGSTFNSVLFNIS